MFDKGIPELTFTNVNYGKRETPLNLSPLLYRGGAATNVRLVFDLILRGKLGKPVLERLPLIRKIHEAIQGTLTAGASRFTVKNRIQILREFYAWADITGRSLVLDSIEKAFIDWTDYLLTEHRISGHLKIVTLASKATTIAAMLDQALELTIGLYRSTRIPKRYNKKQVLGIKADKTKLDESFAFGNALLDISNALSKEVIQGGLPIQIHFRTGHVIEEWCRLRPAHKVKHLIPGYGQSNSRRRTIEARDAWIKDSSWRTRYPLINLRIQTEMLIFISQTGMNLAQVNRLKAGKCSYQSYLNGYQVRRLYKGRRQGEVEFEIFSEYRIIFERYLKWRQDIFPDDEDGLLFPDSSPQQRPLDRASYFSAIKKRCKQLNIRYVSPMELRRTRVNWLVRKSRDPSLTAEMAQHTQETLLRIYDQPHHQSAVSEISRFHASTDPAFEPPGTGTCVEVAPKPEINPPQDAPRPDCISPAGCLFCSNHRDIDDADHVWSLASYRHYKSLELTWFRPSVKSSSAYPTITTIERITDKLKAFELSSEVRALWVTEALNRVEEGDFHPKWEGFIRLIEERL